MLVYQLRHKWFVLLAGRRLGVPLWRLLIHDWSKFAPAEWPAFTRHRNGIETTGPRFDRAMLHHIHHNPHHWQHWLYHRNDGTTTSLEMPEHFAREMVADWMGAERAKTGQWDVRPWYDRTRAAICLHPETRRLVESLLDHV